MEYELTEEEFNAVEAFRANKVARLKKEVCQHPDSYVVGESTEGVKLYQCWTCDSLFKQCSHASHKLKAGILSDKLWWICERCGDKFEAFPEFTHNRAFNLYEY